MNLNPYSLSNQEVEVLEFLQSGRVIGFLTSADERRRQLVFKSFFTQKLSEGKTFFIRTSQKAQMLERLEKWGLDDLVLDLKKDSFISRERLEKSVVADLDYQKEAIKSRIRYISLLRKLKEIQSDYNEPVFGEYHRNKLSELLYLSNKRQLRHHIDLEITAKNYLYSQSEFWSIRNKVEKASKHFKTSYNYLKSSDDFCSDIYKDFHLADNQSIVFRYLNKFLKDAEQISLRYQNTFQSISEQLHHGYQEQITATKRASDALALQISYYKIEEDLAPKKRAFQRTSDPLDSEKKNLRAQYQMLVDLVNNSSLFKINCPENSWNPDVEALSAFNIDLKKLLKKSHLLIKSKVEEQLEIINANNFDAPELSDINTSQQELIFTINASNILKKQIHNLSISSWKNYTFLRELIGDLRKSKLFLEANMDYAIYRSFELSLDRNVKSVISALENIKPHRWVESFEAWYFKALFDKYFIHELLEIESKYDQLEDYKFVDQNYETFRIANTFDRLRYQNDKLYKKVGKDGLDWKSAFISDPKGFQHHFPIVISDEEFFPSEITQLKYDFLVCDENRDIPFNLFDNSQFEAILCLSKSNFSQEILANAKRARNFKNSSRFYLHTKALPADAKLNESSGLNLKMAKFISYVLSEATYEKQFYSGRNFSILTCMSPFCSKLLEIELLEHKIKSLRYDSLDSGIVDDVMIKEDDNKYLLIQDGFLDPTIDMEWQISVLRSIRASGINVISLNSFELALSASESLLDLLDIKELKGSKKLSLQNES